MKDSDKMGLIRKIVCGMWEVVPDHNENEFFRGILYGIEEIVAYGEDDK